MRFVMLAIVLGFPLFDLYVTARFARWTGVPLWVWLAISAISGLIFSASLRTGTTMETATAAVSEEGKSTLTV